MGSTINISNRFSNDVDVLNTLYQEIMVKMGDFKSLGSGEISMKDTTFSDNKEAVKKSLEIHEMKYQKKGKGITKKRRRKR